MRRFLYTWHIIIVLGRVSLLIFVSKGGELPLSTSSFSLNFTFPWGQDGFFASSSSSMIDQTGKIIILSGEKSSADISGLPLNQENSSQHISLDSIIDNISDGTSSLPKDFVTTESLRLSYTNNPTKGTALTLITQLSREFEYDEAYTIFKDLDYTTQHALDPHLVLRILFNSKLIADKNRDILPLQSFIDQSFAEKKLTSDEKQRYDSLLGLVQGNTSGFFVTLEKLQPIGYLTDTIKTLQTRVSQARQGRDIPAYYTQGMLTLGLFEHGYITLSQQLSLALLSKYPNYILPKQILGYTHIILKQRREAKAYFIDLIAADSANSSYYQFFVGVSSYWMQNYVDSILYLSQISSDFMTSDVVRYKILSYLQLKDFAKASKQFKELIGKADIRNADFLLFWEQAIFEPYSMQSDYSLLNQDNTLLDAYLKRCKEGTFDKDICTLGDIAQQLLLKQYYQLDQMILPLVSKFPRSYIYMILAESYTKQGNINEAQKYLVKALSLTKDEKIKKNIKQKLQEVL